MPCSFLQNAVISLRGTDTQMTQLLKASGQAAGTGWSLAGGEIDERTEKHVHSARLRLKALSRFARETELAASIVHQLNQPLASMLANAQAAKRWLEAESPSLMEAIASIDRIVRDAHAAGETMRRIRAIFKREHLDKEEASVIAIVSDAVHLVREDTGKRRIPIEYHCDENLPKLYVDPLAIQEIFINLTSNAVEALEKTKAPLIVIRAAVAHSGEMLVQVVDNGPGICDPEEIFDAFVTTKETGLGVGLTVSRSIAEAHGGRLWAENNPGGGATFCVVLPLSLRDQFPT